MGSFAILSKEAPRRELLMDLSDMFTEDKLAEVCNKNVFIDCALVLFAQGNPTYSGLLAKHLDADQLIADMQRVEHSKTLRRLREERLHARVLG